MNTVIKVENLSKQYRLGNVGLGSLGADVNRWWQTKVLGNEDPYLKIGEENNREVIGNSEYVWALRDINFDVEQGEVLGIIGRNGAGKSTLLKILSRTTGPTTGQIKIKGRVASLLEVGTGFHPELTGRENIFLNGAILGMTKQEIRSKFDEIVAFAGVERYVDTPVKRYSSGMYVRLAFAVAAHLDPEILIVDEVLAVGDAEFQKKAIGKMKEVSEGQGRTVLFVSHNMAAVRNLCNKGIILKNGRTAFAGETNKVVDFYLADSNTQTVGEIEKNENRSGIGTVQFADFYVQSPLGTRIERIMTGEPITFVFNLKSNTSSEVSINLGFSIHDSLGEPVANLYSAYQDIYFNSLNEGYNEIKCVFTDLPLAPGRYYVRGRILDNGKESDWLKDNLGEFDVEAGDFYKTGKVGSIDWNGKLLMKGEWQH